jgi:hypothetical protein
MSKQGSLGKFGVEPSFSYESFPLTPAGGELEDVAQKLRTTMSVQRPGVTDKRAVWIVHGMGQQVPYETLEQLANGLIDAAEDSVPGAPVGPPKFREVRVGKTVLQRVEVLLPRPKGDPQEVHLYECYWAPKTEGAVKLTDVISFLWDGGTRGLINFFTNFVRAVIWQHDRILIDLAYAGLLAADAGDPGRPDRHQRNRSEHRRTDWTES